MVLDFWTIDYVHPFLHLVTLCFRLLNLMGRGEGSEFLYLMTFSEPTALHEDFVTFLGIFS